MFIYLEMEESQWLESQQRMWVMQQTQLLMLLNQHRNDSIQINRKIIFSNNEYKNENEVDINNNELADNKNRGNLNNEINNKYDTKSDDQYFYDNQ